MPFYEYQCEKCGEIYEIFIRSSEDAPEQCEVCGGRLHKIISLSTFHLKGSGWYMTDYTKKNSPVEEKNSGNGSNGNNGSEKTESKKKKIKASREISTSKQESISSKTTETTAK